MTEETTYAASMQPAASVEPSPGEAPSLADGSRGSHTAGEASVPDPSAGNPGAHAAGEASVPDPSVESPGQPGGVSYEPAHSGLGSGGAGLRVRF